MALLKIGSRGSSVKELQQLLNNSGYKLDVDGIYGDKTQSAVRAYQKANGLGVDGIVGDQTWGSLRGGSSTNPDATATPETSTPETEMKAPEVSTPEVSAPEDTEREELLVNDEALQQLLANKPAEYESPYADRINQLYEEIMSRPDFEYDFDADPLYQQYKDRYIQQGQRAMQDTMANAAALSGGYGNSYAASAGQQAYDQYLSGLNDVIGTLMSDAYGRYQDQGQALYDLLAATQGLEEDAYGQYLDRLNQYYTDRDFTYNQYINDRDFAYQQQQDQLAQENYEKELALAAGANEGLDGSPAYNSVLNNAAQMKSSQALAYLQSMVEGGYITQAEADYIYAVELAGGVLSGSGSSGSKSSSGSSSGSKSSGSVSSAPTIKDVYDIYHSVGQVDGNKGLEEIKDDMTELLSQAVSNTMQTLAGKASTKKSSKTATAGTSAGELKKKFTGLFKK